MKKVFFTIFILIIMAILLWTYKFFGSGGAVDQKATYGEMQGVERDYRSKKILTPFVLETANGLRLVGFETGDEKFPYAWLALTLNDTEDVDGIFKIGKAPPWKLTCAQVQELLVKEKNSEEVATFLRRQCNK